MAVLRRLRCIGAGLTPARSSAPTAPPFRLLALSLLCVTGTACAPPDPAPPSDPELRSELGISGDVTIHRIDLGGGVDRTRVLPRATEIRTGEIVQFIALDHRVHLVRFDEEALDEAALAFLRDTGQDSPPPLVQQGARLVLSFDGAPAGSYPFLVDSGVEPAVGEIRVDAAP